MLAKPGTSKAEIGEEEPGERFKDYRREPDLDEMSRCSVINVTPAALLLSAPTNRSSFSRGLETVDGKTSQASSFISAAGATEESEESPDQGRPTAARWQCICPALA
jgi:hypothetical protein